MTIPSNGRTHHLINHYRKFTEPSAEADVDFPAYISTALLEIKLMLVNTDKECCSTLHKEVQASAVQQQFQNYKRTH